MTETLDFLPGVPLDRILEETRLKLAIAREHLGALGEFGITSDWLDQLEADIAAAVAIPMFEQQLAEQKGLTAAKDAKLEACVQWGRKLRYRMEVAFKGRSPAIPFPSKDWNQVEKNESKLIAMFPVLLQLARTQAADLAVAGQTEADLTNGETLLAELVAANQVQEEYKLKRINVTANRRTAFRKLYDSVNRINHSGQFAYGENTANGLLFRSQWDLGQRSPDTDPESTTTTDAVSES